MSLKRLAATALAAAAFAVLWNLIPPPSARAETEGPVSAFTSDPDAHHKKVVWAEGVISSKVKTKRHKGKDYTLFKMKDPEENGGAMLVYLKGLHGELQKGDLLRVRGRFYAKRRYLFIKLKNVLKGREFRVLKPH